MIPKHEPDIRGSTIIFLNLSQLLWNAVGTLRIRSQVDAIAFFHAGIPVKPLLEIQGEVPYQLTGKTQEHTAV